jgi:hypothetical protein
MVFGTNWRLLRRGLEHQAEHGLSPSEAAVVQERLDIVWRRHKGEPETAVLEALREVLAGTKAGQDHVLREWAQVISQGKPAHLSR